MTTTVHIVVPKLNHKRVQVRIVDPTADPTKPPARLPVIVEHGSVLTEYVHGNQQLIIDEID